MTFSTYSDVLYLLKQEINDFEEDVDAIDGLGVTVFIEDDPNGRTTYLALLSDVGSAFYSLEIRMANLDGILPRSFPLIDLTPQNIYTHYKSRLLDLQHRLQVNWRFPYNFAACWRADGLAKSTVIDSNLQTWGDVISGIPMSANRPWQRFTPYEGGWRASSEDLCRLSNTTATGVFNAFAGNNPWTNHVRIKFTSLDTYQQFVSFCAPDGAFLAGGVTAAGLFEGRRFPGPTTKITGPDVLTEEVTVTLAAKYTGSSLIMFLNGIEVAATTSNGALTVPSIMTFGAHTEDAGVTFKNYTNAVFYEILAIPTAQTDAEMLDIHNYLAQDWP